jgi:hypothetical protein
MMISQEHFDALKSIQQEAKNLTLACTTITGAAALIHQSFDREASPRLSPTEEALVGKLRRVK